MARCGCAGTICACAVKAGAGILVQGEGSSGDPYTIINNRDIHVVDTDTANMTRDQQGGDYYLSVDVKPQPLNWLSNVVAPAPVDGYVLKYSSADQSWHPSPATTAPVGSISTGCGIAGNGSSSPLSVELDDTTVSTANIQCTGQGLAIWPGVQPWNFHFRTEGGNSLQLGQSDTDGKYMRWGSMVWIRWGWHVGDGWVGGTGSYHWTAPFEATYPNQATIPGFIKTSDGQVWPAQAQFEPGSDDLTLRVPHSKNNNTLEWCRNADPSTGANGTGWPQIDGVRNFQAGTDARMLFSGWYLIEGG